MTTQINANNIQSSTLATLGSGPTITQIQIADSSWNVLDDSAVSTSGGYIIITGTNFASGCNVIVNTTTATSVSFVNSTTLRVQVGAQSAGSYIVYVVNTDGGTAIMVNGLTYSGTPTWVTTSPLTSGVVDTAISIQLSATGDAPITYALQAGSSLPSGLSLTSGGLLSGTITGLSVETTYNFTIVATDLEAQDSPKAFSITITVGDTYWDYVTTLLSASTPTTLPFNDDASTNNFAVTINGDTKPFNFNPYTPGYYSNYFDGTGDFITAPANSVFQLTGDFTLEAWVYMTTLNAGQMLFGSENGAASDYVSINTSSVGLSLASSVYPQWSYSFAAGQWYHVAVTRSSSTIRVFVNGTQLTLSSGSATSSAQMFQTGANFSIGRYGNTSTPYYFTGYISNARVVKGQALYTAAFTPTTSPFTTTSQGATASNVSYLTCQSNRFIDNSTNNFTITKNGDTKVSSFMPYTPSSSYSTYGSTYFDGTGDYLSTASGSALSLPGDFTFEAWIYLNAGGAAAGFVSTHQPSTTYGVLLGMSAANLLLCRIGTDSVGFQATDSVALSTGIWYHVAAVRSGNTMTLYKNGVSVASVGSITITSDTTTAVIGRYYTDTNNFYLNGYVSDARIVKGTAVYTGNFTPPTTPLTAISGTSLLTCQSNQPVANNTFLDNSTSNFAITRNGNTTQGTFSPYGANWSYYFGSSTNAGLQYAYNSTNGAILAQGTAYTLEGWFYITTAASGNTASTSIPIACSSASSASTASGHNWSFGSTTFGWYDRASSVWLTISWTPPLNQWFHLALVATNGTSFVLYINGTSVGTATDNTSYFADSGYSFYLGSLNGNGTVTANGLYISNLRYSKTAVYSTTFTPSTTPLQPLASTTILTAQSPNFADMSPYNPVVTKPFAGTNSVQKFGPFSATTLPTPYYSAYFDGTGDYLATTTNISALGTGNFTFECWAYPTSSTSFRYLFSIGGDSNFTLALDSGNYKLYFYAGSNILTTTSALNANSWNHVALVRNSGTITIYINGVSGGTASFATSVSAGIGYVGAQSTGSYGFPGYLSNCRLTNTAVYTSAFTPPTSPLTAIANTSLLTCQSSTFIDNSTNNFTITANGNSQPTTVNPFTVTYSTGQGYTPSVFGGSMYFDGTGDYLTAPAAAGNFSGAFTVEFWFNASSVSSGFFVSTYLNSTVGWSIGFPSSGVVGAWLTGDVADITGATSVSVGTWNHVALSGQSGSVKLFLNGVQQGSTFTGSISVSSGVAVTVGILGTALITPYTGYISNLRIVNGTAVYTSNFVPTNAPATAIKNTSLLLNGASAGIYDSSEMSNFETVGDAKLNTTTVKYSGSTSMYFDGSGDYLTTPTAQTLKLAGDFTIETWFYLASAGNYYPVIIGSGNTALRFGDVGFGYLLQFGIDTSSISTTYSCNQTQSSLANQWVHVAWTRSSGTNRLFVNGILQNIGTGAPATSFGSTSFSNSSTIGSTGWQIGNGWNGYLSDFRITYGIARYTSNFSVPTSPFITK